MNNITNIIKDVIKAPERTVVDDLIDQACDQEVADIALHLEIVDLVQQRKTGPREASLAILRRLNAMGRSTTEALIALDILDLLVKNCGYPFHLQLASKEFLNGLVKKFPEHPPVKKSPIVEKTLALIHTWTQTICEQSKYKDDLSNIRELYRLLTYKGYLFPDLNDEDAAALTVREDSLQSKDELESQDQKDMGAKLEELLRRGTPKDLEIANKLMKQMSGYDPSTKVDYHKKMMDKIQSIESSAQNLNSLLGSVKPGVDLSSDKAIQDALALCKSSKPRIEAMLAEEDDEEVINKLIYLNETINLAIAKYENVKAGRDHSNAVQSNSLKSGNSFPISSVPQKQEQKKEMNLLDLDDPAMFSNVPQSQPQGMVHALSGLDFNASNDNLKTNLSGIFANQPTLQPIAVPASPPKILFQGKDLGIQYILDASQFLNTKIASVQLLYFNLTQYPLSTFSFQAAVPKGMQVKMDPTNGNVIQPGNIPVIQVIHIHNPNQMPFRIRFKLSYQSSQGMNSEQGEATLT